MSATSVSTILVPRGAEYQTVYRGLQNMSTSNCVPNVVPIPMGMAAVQAFQWQQQGLQPGSTVLVMGLCGSLRSQYQVGDAVLYQACHTAGHRAAYCDPGFTDWIAAQIPAQFSAPLPRVQALTSARFISTASEKQRLAAAHATDVVDMEGAAILAALAPLKVKVAMLRVVSDGCEWDMPNLTKAIRVNGRLSPSHLVLEMAQQPRASFRFVHSSLHGLRRLRQITTDLFDARKES
jgi:nucleoside phosphorylase